ncbi:class I SAM-dependent methyltransferase [Parasphingorhabdus sp.]|uniref:class I SAM-dependent methyltransferase n=1 Tax=Parasphingorhabdus sp. TaxID=2709688 RepID=UPI0032EDAA23
MRVALPSAMRGKARRLASVVRHPHYIPHWLTPIAFVRWREFEYAFDALRRFAPNPSRLLDVSSPKLFPITVAYDLPNCQVDAVDLVAPDLRELEQGKSYFDLDNLHPAKMDARELAFEDNSFDVVSTVSVIEHVAPEDGGDSVAMREIARVLKPGGIAIVIVPFARNYFAEFREGAVYERDAGKNEMTFYQRFYDTPRLESALVKISGLEEVDRKFIDERHPSLSPHKRYANAIAMTHSHVTRYGLAYPLLSRLLLSPPRALEDCRKPYIACLVLRKPQM